MICYRALKRRNFIYALTYHLPIMINKQWVMAILASLFFVVGCGQPTTPALEPQPQAEKIPQRNYETLIYWSSASNPETENECLRQINAADVYADWNFEKCEVLRIGPISEDPDTEAYYKKQGYIHEVICHCYYTYLA